MRYLILILIALFSTSCKDKQAKRDKEREQYIQQIGEENKRIAEQEATLPEYEIIKKDASRAPTKIIFRIRLQSRIEKEKLDILTRKLKRDNDCKMFYVFYYLPEMETDGLAWASSSIKNYTLETKIVGTTIEQQEDINSHSKAEGKIIGKWYSNISGMSHNIIIYKKGKSTYYKTVFTDGSEGNYKLKKRKKGYIHPHDDTVTIRIEKDGNLGFYDDKNKRYDLLSKLK